MPRAAGRRVTHGHRADGQGEITTPVTRPAPRPTGRTSARAPVRAQNGGNPMTESDQAARDSALNDAEFPDDERGLTGARDEALADTGATGGTEGQTARDVFPEDNGVPDVSQDDFPTMQRNEDPQFAPEPGDRESHQTVSFGTTAFEQSEGESLSQRLAEEIPDDADVRPAEDPARAFAQLDQ